MSQHDARERIWAGAQSVDRQLDFLACLDTAMPPATVARDRRARRGAQSYHAGLAAEQIVERHYTRRGRSLQRRRFKGRGGEVDLVFEEAHVLVFVEVKCSRSHEDALRQVTPRQVRRVMSAASEYLAQAPEGQLSDVRFDVATVDRTGAVRVLEGAFGL